MAGPPGKYPQTPGKLEDTSDVLHEPISVLSPADAAVARDEKRGTDIPSLPVIDASPAGPDTKPTWRGWIHAAMVPVVAVAGAVLLLLADGEAAKWSSAVFIATSLLLFGNSALYHRFDWKPRTKVMLKRIDHANIFLLIAGTYTPMSVLCLPPDKAITLLSIVWGGALLGIGFRVFWITAPRWLYVPLYLLLGWAAVMYLPDFLSTGPVMMLLIFTGGIFYTAGAVVYALKRPNPWPGRFGFHEIFHALTVLAFVCHWTAILLIATGPVGYSVAA